MQIPGSDVEHGTEPDETVQAIAEARHGEVWVGTNRGILAIDTEGFRTRRIRYVPLLRDSLADDSVMALYKDRSGLLWIGTQRAISFYDPGENAIHPIVGERATLRAVSRATQGSKFSVFRATAADLRNREHAR